jgi:hypothetical protein
MSWSPGRCRLGARVSRTCAGGIPMPRARDDAFRKPSSVGAPLTGGARLDAVSCGVSMMMRSVRMAPGPGGGGGTDVWCRVADITGEDAWVWAFGPAQAPAPAPGCLVDGMPAATPGSALGRELGWWARTQRRNRGARRGRRRDSVPNFSFASLVCSGTVGVHAYRYRAFVHLCLEDPRDTRLIS